MADNQNLVALDIGSNTVRIAVGQVVNNKQINIVGFAEVESEGINRGLITNIEDATKSIVQAQEKVEKIIGFPIDQSWVGIAGGDIISQTSRGMVAISNNNDEIQEDDIERVHDAAKMVSGPANYEILHIIPRVYYIDGQKVKDPIGMKGMRLEVEAYIIQALSSQIRNLTKSVYQTGLDIEDVVFSILACSEAVLTNRQKDLGVAVLNIGGAVSSLAVYEEGQLLHMAIMPIGSEHITSDIAIGLRTSIDVAEKIKIKYGSAISKDIDKKEEINLGDFDSQETSSINHKYLTEIIEARVEEILNKVDKELKSISRSGSLPAGIILTGGGAKMPGLVAASKETLRIPAALGYPLDITSPFEDINDISYTTVIGLLKWASMAMSGKKGISRNLKFRSAQNVSETVKRWFSNLLP